MGSLKLIKENKEDLLLPVALYELNEADRDGITHFVFYRGTRYNWTSLEGALKDFEYFTKNRNISLFGKDKGKN